MKGFEEVYHRYWMRPEVMDLEGSRAGFAGKNVTSRMPAKPTFRTNGVRDAPNAHQVGMEADAIARAQLSEDGALPTRRKRVFFRI